MSTITITYTNNKTQQATTVTLPTPIHIGREHIGKKLSIALPKSCVQISRHHAIVNRIDNQIVLKDNSTHGTLLNGQKIHRKEAVITAKDTFRINRYEFIIVEPSADKHKYQPANTSHVIRWIDKDRKERVYPIDTKKTIKIGRNKTWAMIVLDDPTKRISRRQATLTLENGQKYSLQNLSEGTNIYLNKYHILTPKQIRTIQVGDSFEIGQYRLQLLTKGIPMLECVNCYLVNPYHPENECRWCGAYLGHAGTVMPKTY